MNKVFHDSGRRAGIVIRRLPAVTGGAFQVTVDNNDVISGTVDATTSELKGFEIQTGDFTVTSGTADYINAGGYSGIFVATTNLQNRGWSLHRRDA